MDKSESDAKRMGSRGFGGYMADRAAGRHDFKKADAPKQSHARDKQMEDAERKAVGYAKGGMVKMTPKSTPYKCGGSVK